MARIGIDARLWTKTGVGRYIRNLVIALSKNSESKNHDFFLFILPEDIDFIPDLPENFHIIKANFHWHSIGEQLGFLRLLKKLHLDLVHFTYSPAPFFYTSPFIMTVHDLIMLKMKTGKASTLPYPLYAGKYEVYKKLLLKSIKNSQHIIVPTHTIKDELIRYFSFEPHKITVTYEGCDRAFLETSAKLPKELENNKFFLYVGNAYPHKNIETLISGFDEFQKKFPDFLLVLVGRKDFFYKKLVKKHHLEKTKSILYLEDVNDELLSSLYKHAQAYTTASKAEGFGLPVLESLAHTTPVIASNIPVFHEIAKSGTVFFDPEDSQALAKSMEYVVKHSDILRRDIKASKKDILRQFSWDQLAQQTVAVYESCVRIR